MEPATMSIHARKVAFALFFFYVKALSAVGVTVTSHSTELFCILQLIINLLLSHYVHRNFATTQLIFCRQPILSQSIMGHNSPQYRIRFAV